MSTTNFSTKLIYETAVAHLLKNESSHLPKTFDPTVYPLITLKKLADKHNNGCELKGEPTFSIEWRFPVLIKCVNAKDEEPVDDGGASAAPVTPALFPRLPGPSTVECHISLPSGQLNEISTDGDWIFPEKDAIDWSSYIKIYQSLVAEVEEEVQLRQPITRQYYARDL